VVVGELPLEMKTVIITSLADKLETLIHDAMARLQYAAWKVLRGLSPHHSTGRTTSFCRPHKPATGQLQMTIATLGSLPLGKSVPARCHLTLKLHIKSPALDWHISWPWLRPTEMHSPCNLCLPALFEIEA
jgi:hypothetical protein